MNEEIKTPEEIKAEVDMNTKKIVIEVANFNPTTTRKTPNFLLLPPSHSYPVTACIASNTIEKSGRAISALMAPKSKTSCSVFR